MNALLEETLMLKAGDRAPEFVLQNDAGADTSLTDLLVHGPLILYFYPADFTPGCTKEACSIRDMHNDIQSVGLRVAGISPQDAKSHTRFRKEHNLPFVLLCDPDKVAVKMYDVDGPFGVGVRRATFLIGRDRKIRDAVQADVLVSRHAEFIRKAIMLRETAGIRSRGDKQ
jgi:peroxiredoxin Q/BCP